MMYFSLKRIADFLTRLQHVPLSLQAPYQRTPSTETLNRTTLNRLSSVFLVYLGFAMQVKPTW